VYEHEAKLGTFSHGESGPLEVIHVSHMENIGGLQHLSQRQELVEHIQSLGFASDDELHIHQIPTPETYNQQMSRLVGDAYGLRAEYAPIDSLRLAPEETLAFLQAGTLPIPIPTQPFADTLVLDKGNDQWKMLIDHVVAPVHDMAVYGLNFHFLPRSILTETGERIKAARDQNSGVEIPPSMLLAFYRQVLNEFCQNLWCRIETAEQFPLAAEKAVDQLWTQLEERLAQAGRILATAEKNQTTETPQKASKKRAPKTSTQAASATARAQNKAFKKAGLEPWAQLYSFIYEHDPRILRLKSHETKGSPQLHALLCPHAKNLGGFEQLGQVPNLIEHVYNLGFGSHDGKRLDQMPTLETFQHLHKNRVGDGFGPKLVRVDSPLRRLHIEDRINAYTEGCFPILFTSEDFFRSIALTKDDDRWTVLTSHVEQPLVDLSVYIVNFHYMPLETWTTLGEKFRHAMESADTDTRLNLDPILAFYHKDLHDFCHQVWGKTAKASDFPTLAQERLKALEATQDARIAEAIATAVRKEDEPEQPDETLQDLFQPERLNPSLWYDDSEMRPFNTYEEPPPEIAKTGKPSSTAPKPEKKNADKKRPAKRPPKRAKPEHWSDIIRTRLLDQPNRALRMSELMPKEEIPSWGCILPWTRLELGMDQQYGPCCTAYQVEPGRWSRTSNLHDLWNGPGMRQFRQALTSDNPYTSCRTTCPKLEGGSHLAASLELRGGPEFFIERQITLVEDLLNGSEELRTGPLEICFPTTTYCNYDCLMCPYGQIGTLDDELPESFYAQLGELIPGMYLIEALGGEPLASKVFRDFLAGFDFPSHPHIRMSLITNGSYLTPKEQQRLSHVPFTNLTCSLNAATPESYLKVNRGLPYERTRENLDELLRRRHEGTFGGAITYSMVLLKSNYHEIRQFAELARKDGVQFRYMLPMHNLNDESIMTMPDIMKEALSALELTAQEEWKRGQWHAAREMLGEARVLKSRLDQGIFRPIPDDDSGGGQDNSSPRGHAGHDNSEEFTPVAPDFVEREKRLRAAQKVFEHPPGKN